VRIREGTTVKEHAMRIGIVGRGRLGTAMGLAGRAAGHTVVLFRQPESTANDESPLPEEVLSHDVAWDPYDLVLLAFRKTASSIAELERDPGLPHLRRIPASTAIASVVLSPPTKLLDDFLPDHRIAHFITTPAAQLTGAIALLPRTTADTTALRAALPALHWIDVDENEYARLGFLMIGSGIAAASLAHLSGILGTELSEAEIEYLQHVLDDAKRLMNLTGGDGFRALSLLATPGGMVEKIHDLIFAKEWTLER
jgi:hypothetical protein